MANRQYHGCSLLQDAYQRLDKLGEGTFGEVYKARNKSTRQMVALKKIFYHNEREGFPLTALREISILKNLHHENIIQLVDMSTEPGSRSQRARGSIYMVTPYMDHDLCGLLTNPYVKLELSHIKCYMKQLLEGMNFMHQQKYLHRDIKTANILIDNRGIVKIADFGLARKYFEDAPKPGSGAGEATHEYTQMVVTRWYRPIELLLGESKYTTAIDMWGIGCVFGEMFKRRPILQGNSDHDQSQLIFQLLGSPSGDALHHLQRLPGAEKAIVSSYRRTLESRFRELDPEGVSLLAGLLDLNPLTRLTALGALSHRFFTTPPLPARPQDLPKYDASHEMTSKNRQKNAPHAPNVDNAEHRDMESTLPNRPQWNGDNSYNGGNRGRGRYNNNNYHHHGNHHHHNYHPPHHHVNKGGRYHHNNNRHHNHHNNRNPAPPYRRGGGSHSSGPRPPYRSHGAGGPPPPPPPPPPPAPPYKRNPEKQVEMHYDDDMGK